MTAVHALFVDPKGVYSKLLPQYRLWGIARDALNFRGNDPCVAHPPCHLWINMAAANWKRAIAKCVYCFGKPRGCTLCGYTGRREPNRTLTPPAWYPAGSDGGCFEFALAAVRRCGGVLEHPAGSHAWAHHKLFAPIDVGALTAAAVAFGASGWTNCSTFTAPHASFGRLYWVCEVWQSAYGHKARKRTWLLYCGKRPPFELNWKRKPGTHQIGWQDQRGKARNKPTVSKREANATPMPFAVELVRLAEWSRG